MHKRALWPAEPGRPERVDYEYERKGTANLFMVFEPLAGRRRVTVTDRRTKVDFAHVLRDLLDVQYPEAERVVLVMDNLNTHKRNIKMQATRNIQTDTTTTNQTTPLNNTQQTNTTTHLIK